MKRLSKVWDFWESKIGLTREPASACVGSWTRWPEDRVALTYPHIEAKTGEQVDSYIAYCFRWDAGLTLCDATALRGATFAAIARPECSMPCSRKRKKQ